MSVPIKVGIIGYGGSAKVYNLPYILPNPDLEVYAFLQRVAAPSDPTSQGKGSHCTVDFPTAKHYQTPEDFFSDQNIELVVVSTHPDTHAKFAEAALQNGKHVIVEKPFTRTSDEADRLIALAAKKSLLLTCYQNRRWDGDFRTLRHLVEKKALGTIYDATMHYDIDNPAWYKTSTEKEYVPGNGLMFGLGSHTMDQALLLFGRPKYVTGFLQNFGNIGSEGDDAFTIILTYDTPLVVTVKTTMHSPIANQLKYFVRGTSGSYLKEEQIFAGKLSTDADFGIADPSTHGLLTTHQQFDGESQTLNKNLEAYIGNFPTIKGYNRGYYENIVDAIRGNAPLDVKPEDSRNGIRIFELARQSHVEKGAVPWS